MSDVATMANRILPMSDEGLEKIRSLEAVTLNSPQVEIATHHVLHAGMYARTIMVPAGVVLTGALIKCATILILNGSGRVYIGDGFAEFDGYHVLPASAGRKQAFVALTDTHMTMLFTTGAESVAEAENHFTDEAERLFSRLPSAVNTVVITGE